MPQFLTDGFKLYIWVNLSSLSLEERCMVSHVSKRSQNLTWTSHSCVGLTNDVYALCQKSHAELLMASSPKQSYGNFTSFVTGYYWRRAEDCWPPHRGVPRRRRSPRRWQPDHQDLRARRIRDRRRRGRGSRRRTPSQVGRTPKCTRNNIWYFWYTEVVWKSHWFDFETWISWFCH